MKMLGQILVFSLLLGCVGPKNLLMSFDGDERPVEYGFNQHAFDLGMKNEKGVFFIRLQEKEDAFVATEISSVRLLPEGKNQEVLIFSSSYRAMFPAYFSAIRYKNRKNLFVCYLFFEVVHRSLYHPCGSGSKFASIHVQSTVFQNITGIPTVAATLGTTYSVDSNLLAEVAKEQRLIQLSNALQDLHSHAEKMEEEVLIYDRELLKKVAPRLQVVNKTGFGRPDFKVDRLSLSVSRAESLSFDVPERFLLGDRTKLFYAHRDKLSRLKESYFAEERFVLSCDRNVRDGIYNGVLSCPDFVNKTEEGFSPEISLTWASVSLGLLYPGLSGSNKDLNVRIQNGKLQLENLTKGYLEISSIALYGGAEIQENKIKRSLAPFGTFKKPMAISRFSNSEIRTLFTYDAVTFEDIRGKYLPFGIAIKYRSGNSGNFETLHLLEDISLEILIQEKLPRKLLAGLCAGSGLAMVHIFC